MSRVSFFERLIRADELDGTEDQSSLEMAGESIMRHVQHMLNTRQGSVETLPEYGLADFNDMVSRFPDAINEIRRMIKGALDQYEPRLGNVKIEHIVDKDNPLALKFEITARLSGQRQSIWFETVLESDGRATIRG